MSLAHWSVIGHDENGDMDGEVCHCDIGRNHGAGEPTVLPDRLYDITAEWLWREYGHTVERDWNRDAWRLLVMVRAVIDEYATPPAELSA